MTPRENTAGRARPGEDLPVAGNGPATTLRPACRMAWFTAAVAEVAAVWTFINPGLLHGPPAMQGSARGTALVLGAATVPVLLTAVARARAGSGPGVLLWAGSLLHILYNTLLLLFLTPFNAAFLVYVALLGTTVWSIGSLAVSGEWWAPGRAVTAHAPLRAVAVYIWVVAALNTVAWLGRIIPSLRHYPTPVLVGTGVQTNMIYVQDLALWLPLASVAALWLIRRQVRGAVVTAALLGMWVLEALSIAVDQWFGAHTDPTSHVVSASLTGPFLVLAVAGAVPLTALLRAAARGPDRVDDAPGQ